MAIQSGLLGDFWRGYGQRKATTGRGLTRREMTNLLGPVLDYDLRRAEMMQERAQAQSNFERQMHLQDQARADERRAAGIRGATNLGLTYAIMRKEGAFGAGTTAGTTTGAAGEGSTAGIGGAAGGGSTTGGGSLSTTGGTSPGASGGLLSSLGMQPYSASPPIAAQVAGSGAMGYYMGDTTANLLNANRNATYTMRGAGAGAAIGSVVPGVGTVVGGAIGGAVGFIASLF